MKVHKDKCPQNPSVTPKAKPKAKGKGRQQTLEEVVGEEPNNVVETEAVNIEAGDGAVEETPVEDGKKKKR